MPSKKPKIVIYTEQNIIDKLDVIARSNNRSRANLAETIITEYITNFERQNGSISIGDINITGGTNNIDIG